MTKGRVNSIAFVIFVDRREQTLPRFVCTRAGFVAFQSFGLSILNHQEERQEVF